MGVEGMPGTQNGVSSLTYALVVLFALSLTVGAVGVQARADAEAAPPSGEESVQNDYHSTLESSYDSTIDSVNTCPCSVPLTNSAQISRFLLTNLSVWDGEQMRALGDDCVQSTDNESNEVCLILNLTSAYPEAGMLLIPIDKMNSYLPDLAIRDTELQIRGLEGNSYLLLDLSESADGISLTFSSFSLHKEERWFSFGLNETIRLLERPMLVSLQSVPGDVEVRTQSYDASLFSGTQNDRWEYPYDFGIAVTYPNPWMNFAGKWGSDPDSPGDCVPGPVHRVAFNLKDDPRMWHEPRYFLDKAQT